MKTLSIFLSVTITLGTNVSGGETAFYDRVKLSDLVNRAHIIKHLHDRIIVGAFEKKCMKVRFGEDPDQWYHLFLQKKYLCIFIVMGVSFMTYISIKQSKLSILMTMVWG